MPLSIARARPARERLHDLLGAHAESALTGRALDGVGRHRTFPSWGLNPPTTCACGDPRVAILGSAPRSIWRVSSVTSALAIPMRSRAA